MDTYVVFGLGFGDEGKGKITDALVRHIRANLVVRYNGGPQAAHHVMSPNGGCHIFAQFGAGTFRGACTHLSYFMPVELEMLYIEALVLEEREAPSPLQHLTVDERCPVVTPGHKLVGRVREIMRGDARHSSCGLGVGETITDAEQGRSITIGELRNPRTGREALQRILDSKLAEALSIPGAQEHPLAQAEIERFQACLEATSLYGLYSQIFKELSVSKSDVLGIWRVVFEGAQGALLDRYGGFPPYVTQSRATWHNAEELLRGTNMHIKKIGVLRAFSHRHGNGPFVTETHDEEFCRAFADANNVTNEWQGAFRVGAFDLVAMRYGLRLNDGADMLALTNLDRLSGIGPINVCTSYVFTGDPAILNDRVTYEHRRGRIVITAINPPHQDTCDESITAILSACEPFEWITFDGFDSLERDAKHLDELPEMAREFVRWIESSEGLNTPIGIISLGPYARQTMFLF
jgi:adenylosuccinate synthase